MGFSTLQADISDRAERSVEWEETDCLLCGSPRRSLVVEGPDNLGPRGGLWFAVVRCKDCGLHYTSPRPSAATISSFYPRSYFPKRAPAPSTSVVRRRATANSRRARRNGRKVLPLHGQGRLLDFGCGGGSYLDRMSRQGWRVTGLDVAAPAVRRIRSELGLSAYVGTLPHPEIKPESFDVVTMWHSLEHVHDPAAVLREAFFHLAPGGKILVAVPNIESLAFRWFGRHWYALDVPRHLTHFSPRTLSWMLERSGFRVECLRMVRQTAWLRWSARIAAAAGDARRSYRLLAAKAGSRLAAGYSCLTGRSDCMVATAYRAD